MTNNKGHAVSPNQPCNTSPTQLRDPGTAWRMASTTLMATVGLLVRGFMNGPNSLQTHGLQPFLALLDQRRDISRRTRGLITVSNHISVMDDPLLWGMLPLAYHLDPRNNRWSLASYDICFGKSRPLDVFWNLGQTLPTHRKRHSVYGGLFQPTLREAIRLLCHHPISSPSGPAQAPSRTFCSSDPFSDPTDLSLYTYTTDGRDRFPVPSAYVDRRHAWVHIFPEGKVHQHPHQTMRYFKWGVARLVLEADECPDIIPIWLQGTEQIMHEDRPWPRFLPRVGISCAVWIGPNIAGEADTRNPAFDDLRRRWRLLVRREIDRGVAQGEVGELSDDLKYGREAVALREECALQIRKAVLDLRRQSGLVDEDPKVGLAETWREEGDQAEGKMEDGSWVGRT